LVVKGRAAHPRQAQHLWQPQQAVFVASIFQRQPSYRLTTLQQRQRLPHQLGSTVGDFSIDSLLLVPAVLAILYGWSHMAPFPILRHLSLIP